MTEIRSLKFPGSLVGPYPDLHRQTTSVNSWPVERIMATDTATQLLEARWVPRATT